MRDERSPLRPPLATGAEARRPCEACGALTEHLKPYCVQHFALNSYAKHLLAEFAQRALDDALVARDGAVSGKLDAVTPQEILWYLDWRGRKTFRRLCRDLALDRTVAWGYVTLLHIHRRIARQRSKQGVWTIEIWVEGVGLAKWSSPGLQGEALVEQIPAVLPEPPVRQETSGLWVVDGAILCGPSGARRAAPSRALPHGVALRRWLCTRRRQGVEQ